MRILKFLAGLALATLLEAAGTRLLPAFPRWADLFLVLVVTVARAGVPERALFAGVAAGWATDALAGGPFGLFGFADSAVGYLTALVAQRLVVQRRISLAGIFAAAAATQGVLLTLLGWLIVGGRELPHPTDLAIRIATTAAAGVLWSELSLLVTRRLARSRKRPSGALRTPRSLLP